MQHAFFYVPVELIVMFASFLDLISVGRWAQTCKYINGILDEQYIQHRILQIKDKDGDSPFKWCETPQLRKHYYRSIMELLWFYNVDHTKCLERSCIKGKNDKVFQTVFSVPSEELKQAFNEHWRRIFDKIHFTIPGFEHLNMVMSGWTLSHDNLFQPNNTIHCMLDGSKCNTGVPSSSHREKNNIMRVRDWMCDHAHGCLYSNPQSTDFTGVYCPIYPKVFLKRHVQPWWLQIRAMPCARNPSS